MPEKSDELLCHVWTTLSLTKTTRLLHSPLELWTPTSTCTPCASPIRRRRTSLLSRCLPGSTRSTSNELEARPAADPLETGGSYNSLKYLAWLASSSIVLIYLRCSGYVVAWVQDGWTVEPDGVDGGLGCWIRVRVRLLTIHPKCWADFCCLKAMINMWHELKPYVCDGTARIPVHFSISHRASEVKFCFPSTFPHARYLIYLGSV